ncbi:STAS domain-containing protein [bacterium]|nr:STAS domain-containing protein [bacterium]
MGTAKEERIYTLHFSGRLLGEMESRRLSEAIGLLVEDGVHHLVLDIGSVELINTPGAVFLAEMFCRFRQRNGSFAVCRAQSPIETILKKMKLQAICG